MSELSYEARQALLYVKKHQPVPIYEIPFEITRFDYLLENDFIEKTVIRSKRYPDGYIETLGIKITARGKDALFRSKNLKKEFLLNRFLAISSLIISLLAAFTPFADECKEWIKSLLSTIFQ